MTSAWDGRPQNPERDGTAHWLTVTNSDGDTIELVGTWESDEWMLPSLERSMSPGELVKRGARYLGPCHTPAEVAAQIEAARREERETAGDKAESLANGLTVNGRDYEAGYANGALDAARLIRARGAA